MKLTVKHFSLIIIAAALAYFVYSWTAEPKYSKFAKCLTENGATMYGTSWCHFCQNQKALFGRAFEEINYKDCDINKGECNEAGVGGYPTWRVNDENYAGLQSLERLSILTGCSL